MLRSTIFWTWKPHCTHDLIASLCAAYTRLDTSSFHYGREIEFMRCHLTKELLTINAWWKMDKFFFSAAATGELTILQDITPTPMLTWANLSKLTSHKKNPKIHNTERGLVEDRQGFHVSGREEEAMWSEKWSEFIIHSWHCQKIQRNKKGTTTLNTKNPFEMMLCPNSEKHISFQLQEKWVSDTHLRGSLTTWRRRRKTFCI